MRIIHISGHVDLTPEEFQEHYKPRILLAVDEGCSFVIGDARGADTMAQDFLARIPCDRVSVFHMFTAPRHNAGSWATWGGFISDRTRDEALTLNSTEDIAWVRPGREKSGTAKNLARRKKATSP